ncbi:putative kynurenine 3-monooxygenase [Mycena albidolilacea]|uniref:Kynurenine 3-monooxygenase n=1 Tax=Mycena albidolilacea TaxID=1033008 RepID=A0AAD6ZY41_9AGAR|nr:putative kynurenine 3-monooxygenase [Mycena albidolilacea]
MTRHVGAASRPSLRPTLRVHRPASTAASLALPRPSSIFELRPTRTVTEGSISSAPNAPVVGVYDPAAFFYHRLAMHADDGYLFGHLVQYDDEYTSILHNIMVNASGEQPDLAQVRHGARITHIKERDDGVTLHFEDGRAARGDILIGADGIHSKVCEHVLGASAPTPTFLGSCMVTGTLPLTSINAPPRLDLPRRPLHPVSLVPDRAAWREYEASGEAARAAKRNHEGVQTPVIRALMDNVRDDAVKLWTPYCIPDIPSWHRGRVCLIGDAAHALPPNGHVIAMAFEDAVYLARLLVVAHNAEVGKVFAQSDVARVLTQFERNRRPRIERVRTLAYGTGGAKGGTPAA